jgi:hypothetical protein
LIPEGFVISPLPSDISSFAILALQTIESSLIQNRKKPTKNETASGVDGSRSAPKPASTLTLSSSNCNHPIPNSSSEPFSLPVPSGRMEQGRRHSWQA